MSFAPLGGRLLGDDGTTPDGAPILAGEFDGTHLLVPLLSSSVPAVTDQVRVAATLARATGASISAFDPSTAAYDPPTAAFEPALASESTPSLPAPSDPASSQPSTAEPTASEPPTSEPADSEPATSESAASEPASSDRSETSIRQSNEADEDALLEWALERTTDSSVRRGGGFFGAQDAVDRVLRAVGARDVDTLVLPGEAGNAGRFRRDAVDRIATSAACDVVVVNGRPGYDSVPSILLPIAGGPHSGLAADVAGSVAADCGAWVDVLHVVEADATEWERQRATELVEDAARRVARPETTSTWILEADDVASGIIEQSQYYGLTVVGAPTAGALRQFIYGSTNQSVRSAARSVVLSARNYDPDPDGG